jgi:hypothetical protein
MPRSRPEGDGSQTRRDDSLLSISLSIQHDYIDQTRSSSLRRDHIDNAIHDGSSYSSSSDASGVDQDLGNGQQDNQQKEVTDTFAIAVSCLSTRNIHASPLLLCEDINIIHVNPSAGSRCLGFRLTSFIHSPVCDCWTRGPCEQERCGVS